MSDGWTIPGAWASPMGVMSGVGLAAAAGSVVGMVVAPLWWLPFTVSTVLGRRWPVTLAVGAIVPPVAALLVVLLLLALL